MYYKNKSSPYLIIVIHVVDNLQQLSYLSNSSPSDGEHKHSSIDYRYSQYLRAYNNSDLRGR